MIFRGIKLIKPLVVERNKDEKKELYFDNILPHDVREAWLRAGYPVYYDHIANKSYTVVDNISWFGVTEDSEAKCECGSDIVFSSKHSTWCGKFQ